MASLTSLASAAPGIRSLSHASNARVAVAGPAPSARISCGALGSRSRSAVSLRPAHLFGAALSEGSSPSRRAPVPALLALVTEEGVEGSMDEDESEDLPDMKAEAPVAPVAPVAPTAAAVEDAEAVADAPAKKEKEGTPVGAKNQDRGSRKEQRERRRNAPNEKREQVPQDDARTPPGSIVTGTVVWCSGFGAEVKLDDYDGPSGFMPSREGPFFGFDKETPPPRGRTGGFKNKKNQGPAVVEAGVHRRFRVLDFKNRQGGAMLSARQVDQGLAWDRVRQIREVMEEDKETIKGTIISANPGGVVTIIEGLRAFVPRSHLGFQRHSDQDRAAEEANSLVGTEQDLFMLEADETKNNLLCSIRVARVFAALRDVYPGAVIDGFVRQITDFGAFVGLNGTKVSGLLHISNISRAHVDSVHNVFEEGDKIRCIVLDVDESGQRISLSTAELEEEDGQMLEDQASVYERADENAVYYREHLERQMAEGDDEYYE